MTYVDGYVIAVPTNNRDAFTKHANEAAAVFKEHGASSVVECWGDDVPDGKVTSFLRLKGGVRIGTGLVWPKPSKTANCVW